ncbi:MAG: hypothetical protein AB8B83_04210, partial [Bdellovibrionales bacterium]
MKNNKALSKKFPSKHIKSALFRLTKENKANGNGLLKINFISGCIYRASTHINKESTSRYALKPTHDSGLFTYKCEKQTPIKKNISLRKGFACLAALLLASTAPAYATTNGNDPEILIRDGEFFGEVRYRYEDVQQDGFINDAKAHTIRTNLGFKTGEYKGFKAAIEAQIVQNIGDEDFNSTTNGNTAFPIVADPNITELNELWLSWSGLPQTNIKIGRQKMNIDNQ